VIGIRAFFELPCFYALFLYALEEHRAFFGGLIGILIFYFLWIEIPLGFVSLVTLRLNSTERDLGPVGLRIKECPARV